MSSSNLRMQKINSLLRESISEIILKEVEHPKISNKLVTVTRVETSKDLQMAKVFVSIMPGEHTKEESLKALATASGFIACKAAKIVHLRYFPNLTFYIDEAFSKQDKIDSLLWQIRQEQESQNNNLADTE